MATVHWDDLNIGDELPGFTRKTDFMSWNRYAAVNDEFVYVHMDDEAGAAAGQGAAFGMGNLRWAYVLNMLRDWAGEEGDIRELKMQFRAINHKNDVLTAGGRIVEKVVEDGSHIVRLEIGVVNQDGVETSPGTATVELPTRG